MTQYSLYWTGESLAELQTDDEDSHDTFTYELLKNDGGLFSLSGHSIVSKKMFDFEEQKALEFEIQVKSTDNGTPPLSVSMVLCLVVLKSHMNFKAETHPLSQLR